MKKVTFLVLLSLFTTVSLSETKVAPSAPSAQTRIDLSAHWLNSTTVVIGNSDFQSAALELIYFSDESQRPKRVSVLKKVSLSAPLKNKFPHLKNYNAYEVATETSDLKTIIKHKLAIKNTKTNRFIGVQIGNLIDQLYTESSEDADELTSLGAVVSKTNVTATLWAPLATSVELLIFKDPSNEKISDVKTMSEDSTTGSWQVSLPTDMLNQYYRFRITQYYPQVDETRTVEVTDPYSLSLSSNSRFSQFVDLSSSTLMPNNWQKHHVPILNNIEQQIIYETHIRDFSANDLQLADKANKGKYKAFTEKDSDGIKHLKWLRSSGLNTIHLLPAFDIGTVNEDENSRISLNDTIAKLCKLKPMPLCESDKINKLSIKQYLQTRDPKTDAAQEVIQSIRTLDEYNWGYDPFHYNVPEGSYASNADGSARIVEFRQMIQALHTMGFRVVMDVVYNHTHEAGLNTTSVLDKVVPNYYQRLNPLSGQVEQSTCCDNTATERVMMAKLMTDSLVVWAREYKIDGFRFDLMGHQPKDAMLAAREAVREIDPDTYFYGEGWNFGEVANHSRFEQASQLAMAGSEIGTFTDRLRDAVRGGASFSSGDEYRVSQGIGNGLGTIDNELNVGNSNTERVHLLYDQLRIGLAGNLADFPLTNSSGNKVTGKDIPYGDQPAGYALDPADTINYVSKHDNQTLWDNNQYRIAFDVSTQDRVRLQLLSLSFPLYAQGIPFLHMGSEMLRSKSFLRDSYDYGDWFNAVDFSLSNNNYNVGLPPADKDKANWPLISKLIRENEGRDIVGKHDIAMSSATFNNMLKIRSQSPLFSLKTADDVISRLTFLNTETEQQAGVIAMRITDSITPSLDPKWRNIIVIFNNSPSTQTFKFNNAANYKLHPVLVQGADEIIKQAKTTSNAFHIPKLSAAVFVEPHEK